MQRDTFLPPRLYRRRAEEVFRLPLAASTCISALTCVFTEVQPLLRAFVLATAQLATPAPTAAHLAGEKKGWSPIHNV